MMINVNKDAGKNTISFTLPWMMIAFIILLTAKVAGWESVAGLSWWWITCPLWGPPAIAFGLWAAICIIAAFCCGIYALWVILTDR